MIVNRKRKKRSDLCYLPWDMQGLRPVATPLETWALVGHLATPPISAQGKYERVFWKNAYIHPRASRFYPLT